MVDEDNAARKYCRFNPFGIWDSAWFLPDVVSDAPWGRHFFSEDKIDSFSNSRLRIILEISGMEMIRIFGGLEVWVLVFFLVDRIDVSGVYSRNEWNWSDQLLRTQFNQL